MQVSKWCNYVRALTHTNTNEWKRANQIINENAWKFKCSHFFGFSLLPSFLNALF